jgi:hypothetical protein
MLRFGISNSVLVLSETVLVLVFETNGRRHVSLSVPKARQVLAKDANPWK